MRYRIEFSPKAEREFKKLPRPVQVRLKTRIDVLAEEPLPPGAEKLSGEDRLFRIRVGDYRIIYANEDEVLLVLVVKVGHRRDVYRGLP